MTPLKFSPALVPLVLSGEKTSTWRLFDDKDLREGDELVFLKKSDGQEFARAVSLSVVEKRFEDLTHEDDEVRDGHEQFASADDRLATYRGYYGERVNDDTVVKIVKFILKPL